MITRYFTRLVLGIQLVLAGIQLPSRYLRIEWKSLSLLLGPVMCTMWIVTSLLVYAMVPNLPFLHALAIGSCVTPTDPILSNNIVKGKFADHNIPKELQKIVIAESGANDGLGYPFLFLALYLIKYVGDGGAGTIGGAGKAMGYWFGITWGYTIVMSVLYGILIGYIFRKALRFAEQHKFVDRESFLIFAISIALFISGTAGMLGSDDVLACFVAGNVFTWDDWFRLETEDDSFQPTIDLLLNVSIFAYYGAIAPWYSFAHNSVIPIYRLIFLGILVLLLRRLPIVFAFHKQIHQIEHWQQALFVGFFGPIGVSAIFYLYVSLEFLADIRVGGEQRQDADRLSETMTVVVWFMAISSIVVHGLSIPLGKIGFYLPRTLSRSVSVGAEPEPFQIRRDARPEERSERALELGLKKFSRSRSRGRSQEKHPRQMFPIGGRLMGPLAQPPVATPNGTSVELRAQPTAAVTPSSTDEHARGQTGSPSTADTPVDRCALRFAEDDGKPQSRTPELHREIRFSGDGEDTSRITAHGRGTLRFPEDYVPMGRASEEA